MKAQRQMRWPSCGNNSAAKALGPLPRRLCAFPLHSTTCSRFAHCMPRSSSILQTDIHNCLFGRTDLLTRYDISSHMVWVKPLRLKFDYSTQHNDDWLAGYEHAHHLHLQIC